MKLLHLDSSILGDNSVSRQLSASIVSKLKQQHAGIDVNYRDLAANPISHLSGILLAPPEARNAEQQTEFEDGAKALEDFLASDIIVIGAPMYNFSVPSQLKAWIDRVSVAGKTFKYGANGPEGLAGGKKLIIASSRGGVYSQGSPAEAVDHQEKYLHAVFSFLGITDISFIRAEGVAMGPDVRQKAMDDADQEITKLAA
jgi:FMN-dependent NADH-azoreductase